MRQEELGWPSEKEIIKKLRKSVLKLFNRDEHLFKVDANEITINHKLACYLQGYFSDWDVDIEYNCDGHEIKRIEWKVSPDINIYKSGHHVVHEYVIRPDIIIHKRSRNQNDQKNLLAVEIKKSTDRRPLNEDFKKLRAFKKWLHYRNTAFLKFKSGNLDVGLELAKINAKDLTLDFSNKLSRARRLR